MEIKKIEYRIVYFNELLKLEIVIPTIVVLKLLKELGCKGLSR